MTVLKSISAIDGDKSSADQQAAKLTAGLREELKGLKLYALQECARSEKANDSEIADAVNASDPKLSLINLILSKKASRTERCRSDVREARSSRIAERHKAKFDVGDRVEALKPIDGHCKVGDYGTVKEFRKNLIYVLWDKTGLETWTKLKCIDAWLKMQAWSRQSPTLIE
jgi:hypothetical protein